MSNGNAHLHFRKYSIKKNEKERNISWNIHHKENRINILTGLANKSPFLENKSEFLVNKSEFLFNK